MSMSTHITGFRPPDELWAKHKAVWDACVAADIDPPEETDNFFDGEAPDPNGIECDVPHREFDGGDSEGYEVTVADIPEHITVIRFWNNW